MDGRPQDFMTVGLTHFMTFPEVAKGDGPILETLKVVCDDPYFGAVEVTSVRDATVREAAIAMASAADVQVVFGARPVLLDGDQGLGSPLAEVRRRATDAVRRCMDEAAEWGARSVVVLSGPDPGPSRRLASASFLIASLKELSEHSRWYQKPPVLLETFDRVPFGRNCLIGPTDEAAALMKHTMAYYPSTGLVLDLAHLPLLGESSDHAVKTAAPYLKYAHVGNCVKRVPAHPAYGDNHPPFGIPEGEVGVDELAGFLRALIEVGYVAPGGSNVVSLQIKPLGAQRPSDAIRNAKETLNAAWKKA